MYLGFALILLAQSCFLTNLYTLIGTVIFVVYIHRFQIIPEQRMLLNHFGQVYSDYMQRVRPWI
jgi:protein-S-isoprenylcysteine O-methyltransferase Ste14